MRRWQKPSVEQTRSFLETVQRPATLAGQTVEPAPLAGQGGQVSLGQAEAEGGADADAESASALPHAEGGPLPYLEQKRKSVDGDLSTPTSTYRVSRTVVKACGCTKWVCSHCCQSKGLKLQKKAIAVLKTFEQTILLTLTVDPKLFNWDPVKAYLYCTQNRVISELMRALWKAHDGDRMRMIGERPRYFYVVEFQKNGMLHFHVLVEANRVDHKILCQLWGRNRPADAPAWDGSYEASLKGHSPEFGTVRFSKRETGSAESAAKYACKYLIKVPENGYPDYILDDKCGEVKHYGASRGFFCEATRGDAYEPHKPTDEKPADPPRKRAQYCERLSTRSALANCGVNACVIEETDIVDSVTHKVIDRKFQHLFNLDIEFEQVPELLCIEPVSGRKIVLLPGDFPLLCKYQTRPDPYLYADFDRPQKHRAT